jgi:cation:H+ antiporter
LGSNIFNILAILGVTSQMGPLQFSWELFGTDVLELVGISVLVIFFARTGFRLARREGLCLLACYGGFLALLGS